MTSGLAVGNLGLTNVSVNLELTEQTVDDDLEVQLAHAGDDGLAGLVVGGHLEGRVLLGELGQSQGHLVLLGLGLGLDGNVDNGLSELDLLEDDLLALAHRVSPVVEFLKPTQATMSPAAASSRSIRSAAFISRMRPRRSR